MPLLGEEQEVRRAVSGLHGTALAVGAVLAGLVGPHAVARFGRGAMLRAGILGISAGVLIYIASGALPLTLLGALVSGTFGSVLLNTHSPVLTARHPGGAGTAAVSEANAFGAATGMAAPLLVGGAVAVGLGWRVGLLGVVVLGVVVLLVFLRTTVPDHRADLEAVAVATTPVETRSGSSGAGLPRAFWWAWAVLVLCISVEFSMTIWASDLLQTRVGMGDGAAAAGVTAIVGGMAAGRFGGSRLALRYPTDLLLLAAIATAVAGWAIFWAATVPWLALGGLLVSGLGIGLHFPLGITRAIVASAGHPDKATARVSLGAGLAIGSGPFVLGYLADNFGTHRAFILVPVLLAAAGAAVLLSRASAAAGRAAGPLSRAG